MSHSFKLEELRRSRTEECRTYLYFVCTDDAEINVGRVANRVEKGGHSVAPDKIRSRCANTLQNLYPAKELSNRAFLVDNSARKINLIAEIRNGSFELKVDELPGWFNKYELPHFC